MDQIDHEIRIRDWGEPVLVASTAVLFDYFGLVELFERTGAFYDNDTLKVILILPVVMVILRKFIYKYSTRLWNLLSPIKKENFVETVLSRVVPYFLIISVFQLLVTRLPPVEVMAGAAWLIIIPIPACIFGAFVSLRVKAMIEETKSAKYSRK